MGIPVTEAERTPEGARDRFRRVTQGVLDCFRERVVGGKSVSYTDLVKDLTTARKEYDDAIKRLNTATTNSLNGC